jgi:hypothetical protein
MYYLIPELIESELLSPSVPISYCTMDMICEERLLDHCNSADEIENWAPTFLYRVIPGRRRNGRSLAIWCAKNALVPQKTLTRGMPLLKGD